MCIRDRNTFFPSSFSVLCKFHFNSYCQGGKLFSDSGCRKGYLVFICGHWGGACNVRPNKKVAKVSTRTSLSYDSFLDRFCVGASGGRNEAHRRARAAVLCS